MNRLLIPLLAAFDAAVAAATGVAVVLAPLTVLWVFGLGGEADWGALWPASATVWQLGHLVPLSITLPAEYLVAAGIDPTSASFGLSLAPLAFAAFTAIFAARSGARASRAVGWASGVVTGSAVFAVLATVIALTSASAVAASPLWQAILFPALVYAVPALIGALVVEWSEADAGVVARVRDRVESTPGWGVIPALAVRGTGIVLAGLIGLGALGFVVALAFGGDEVIALFEAGHMDALGATLTTLAQLAYLPTLIIWAFSYIAGPGFAIGVDSAVSPAGTQVGVVPGVPILGAVPGSLSPWLLLLALLPVALGALAGWVARSRLVAPIPPEPDAAPSVAPWASASLEGLIGAAAAHEEAPLEHDEPIAPRLALTAAIAVLAGAGAALLAVLASGSIGPVRMAEVGPHPGPVALAVGVEVFIGAAILLLSPRRQTRASDVVRDAGPTAITDLHLNEPDVDDPHIDDDPQSLDEHPTDDDPTPSPDLDETAPLPPLIPVPPSERPPGPAPRRPAPLPPLD